MITTSAEFGEQMGSNARKLYAQFLIDSEVVESEVKEVKINLGGCGDSSFSVGNVYSSYITATIDDCPTLLENRELELQIGVELTDGTVEYCTVGFYTASDVATSVGTTTFTGLGRLSSKCGSGYWSDNGWPQTVQSALDEIASQTGVSIDASACDSDALALNIETSMDGLLHREALMYIAGLLGGFATEHSDGGIVIRPFDSTVAAEMDADRTTELFEFSDYDYTVTGVEVIVSESGTDEDGNEVEGVSYTYGTPNLTLSNPYMTQALFDLMAPQITGFTYRPGTVPLDMGDIRLEAGDMISAVDAEGVSRTVACLLLEHTFDGGLMTTITAPGESETEQGAAFTGSLSAAVEKTATELLVAKQVTATKLEAVQANIDDLTAKAVTTEYLTANYITADDISATYIKADELEATIATFGYITADQIDTYILNAGYITADSAVITDLTAEVANINSVLAGNVGAGTVQTVHLTSENVVIDDAVINDAAIVSLTASKITSGTIYTNLVTIQSESGNLYIADNTIQIQDANSVVRVQIGEDATGDYNLYLWDASGNLLWDAEGLYAAGIHDGIIKDIAVADDAAISGTKLDIASVASELNKDGSITVNAAQVTIDDTTLEYRLTSITTATNEAVLAAQAAQDVAAALESEAVSSITQYYAVGDNAEEPPSDPEDGVARAAALVGTAIVGESKADTTETSGDWTTEFPTISDGQYLWTAFYVVYIDESTEWTTPTCLTDGVARSAVSTLQTELEVVQGQITAKVWQTDIDTAISNIAIGGRNYVLNSGGYTVDSDTSCIFSSSSQFSSYYTVTANDGYMHIECTTSLSTSRLVFLYLSDEFDPSESYTLTAKIRTGETSSLAFYLYRSAANSSIGSYTPSEVGEWETVQFTVTPDSSYTWTGIGFSLSNYRTTGDYVDIAWVKLEKGTVATDWTPAPEDTTNTLTTMTDKYASVTVTLDSITDEVASLTTTVDNNYSTLTSQISTLEETTESISATVSSNYTALTAADPKYGTCSTAAATAAKVVTCSSFTTLSEGATICVYFTYANTAASPTLNVNGTGAKTIYAYGAAIASGSDYNWVAGSCVTFVYSGSQWCMVDAGSYSKIASLQITADGIVSTVSDLQQSLVCYTNRNYALYSGDYAEGDDPAWYLSSTAAESYYTISVEDGYTRIYCDTTTSTDYYVWLDLSDEFDPSVTHTISFKVRLSYAAALALREYYKSGNSAINDQLKSFTASNFSSGEWVTLSYTFTPTSTYTYQRIGFSLANVKTAERYLDIEYIMVEQGDTVHDWEPAPEDCNTSSLVNTVKSNTSQITQLASAITLCVTTDEDTGYLRLGTGEDGTVKFTVEADNLQLDESGNLTLTGNLTVVDKITMSSDESAYIEGPSRVYIKSIVYGEAGFVVPNGSGVGYYGKLSDGQTNTQMLCVSSSNIITLGNTSYATRITGSAITVDAAITSSSSGYYAAGLSVANGSSYGYSVRNSSSTDVAVVYMSTSNQLALGSSSYVTRIYGSTIYSNVSITTSSDERLKQDIALLDDAHSALFDGLQAVTYRYRANPGKVHMGLTVQTTEAAELAAGLDPGDYALTSWYEDEDGEQYGALAYDEVIALLVQQVQELKTRVQALEE